MKPFTTFEYFLDEALTQTLTADSMPFASFTRFQNGTIDLTKPLTLKGSTSGTSSFYIKATTFGNIAATGKFDIIVGCSDSTISSLSPKGYDWKL